MQIIWEVSKLKCLLVYERSTLKEVNDELDEKLIELASRLSALISSEPFVISTNSNVEPNDFVPISFQTCKTMNLIFRCFDKSIGGNYTREETIPISLCFDTIIDKEFIDQLFKDQYINLEPGICGLIDTLINQRTSI